MTKTQKHERDEAIERLRGWLKPGDTVHVICRHVSRSGMLRILSPIKMEACEQCHGTGLQDTGSACGYCRGGVQTAHLGYNVARALGWRPDKDQGVYVAGCGMDMGFHLVYELSGVLFGAGYECTGAACSSPEHQRRECKCEHGSYEHNRMGRKGDSCEVEGCGCKHWRPLPDKRGAGIVHKDGGYALKHSWL